MIEHILSGAVQICPLPGGGRELAVVTSEDEVFRVPMSEEQAVEIGRGLSLSGDELEAEIKRRSLTQNLVVAQQMPNGHGISQN